MDPGCAWVWSIFILLEKIFHRIGLCNIGHMITRGFRVKTYSHLSATFEDGQGARLQGKKYHLWPNKFDLSQGKELLSYYHLNEQWVEWNIIESNKISGLKIYLLGEMLMAGLSNWVNFSSVKSSPSSKSIYSVTDFFFSVGALMIWNDDH